MREGRGGCEGDGESVREGRGRCEGVRGGGEGVRV